MRIPRFYCPDLNVVDEVIKLPTDAHRHAVQVLRLKAGAMVRLFDGAGAEYEAKLHDVSKRESTAILSTVVSDQNESNLSLTLIQGISRGERMDYTLQKAVELGVNRIVPVVTERCNVQLSGQRADKKLGHWQGVIISACEQSGRRTMPALDNIISFDEMLSEFTSGSRLLLEPTATVGFKHLSTQTETSLVIGPEGGFSETEIEKAINEGFQAIQFGPRILRTETAAVAALAVIQMLWGDLG
jgi:16S rRNA (uracil1498-N3)-methyltransferase